MSVRFCSLPNPQCPEVCPHTAVQIPTGKVSGEGVRWCVRTTCKGRVAEGLGGTFCHTPDLQSLNLGKGALGVWGEGQGSL